MKCICAFIAVVSVQLASGRGLKAPRAADVDVVSSKQLQVENEELKQKNDHLEDMMQIARTEIIKMDARVAQQRQGNSGESDVLKQEITDMRKKLKSTESEEGDLVQTLRKMLTKNSSKVFQKEAERAQDMKMALEMRCANERQNLEAQVTDANTKCADTKELAKNLQEENADLQERLKAMQAAQDSQAAELAKALKASKDLSQDKANLVATMQSLMRESSKLKEGLQREADLEKKEAKELVVEQTTLAKVGKSTAGAPAEKQQPQKVLRQPKHKKHEVPLTAKQRLHMQAINGYIDTAEASSDDVPDEKLNSLQKQERLFEKGKVGAHLSDWLGMGSGSQDQEQKVVKMVKIESEADSLLADANAQLAAMDNVDA